MMQARNKYYVDPARVPIDRVKAALENFLLANPGRAAVDFTELKTKLAAGDRAVADGVLHQALSELGHTIEDVPAVRPEFEPEAQA